MKKTLFIACFILALVSCKKRHPQPEYVFVAVPTVTWTPEIETPVSAPVITAATITVTRVVTLVIEPIKPLSVKPIKNRVHRTKTVNVSCGACHGVNFPVATQNKGNDSSIRRLARLVYIGYAFFIAIIIVVMWKMRR